MPKRSQKPGYSSSSYVDDLLDTHSSQAMISKFKKEMAGNFEMSDIGLLTYYLGIEVLQHKDGIILSQERYAKKILCETGMDECNAVQSPMEFGLKISKANEEEGTDEKDYQQSIGCLHAIPITHSTRYRLLCRLVKQVYAQS